MLFIDILYQANPAVLVYSINTSIETRALKMSKTL